MIDLSEGQDFFTIRLNAPKFLKQQDLHPDASAKLKQEIGIL